MADKAHIATDKQLEQMEKHLRKIYKRAAKELEEKMRVHLEQFPIDDEKMKKAVEAGEMTQREYRNWRQKQVMLDRHYKRMEKQIASDISQVNVQAQAYINDQIPKVYATNYNYTGNDIKAQAKKMGGGYSFTLTNADTVKNLATKDKTLLPYKYVDGKKDVRWNTKKVNSEILQGILQGESIPKIAKRMENVVGMDYRSAVSNARTCVTSSENKGRLDGLYRAREKGVIMQKGWLATNDSRTRDSHAAINGRYVDIDDEFPNGLQYPADPEGVPAEVYNCRCTLVTKVVGFEKPQKQEREPEIETEGVMVGVKRLGSAQTVDSVAKAVNVNYGKSREHEENCANCVVAAEARYRGYDVVAKRRVYTKDSKIHRFWYKGVGKGSWTDSFDGMVCEEVNATRKKQLAGAISKKMEDYGEGSRAVVFVEWQGHSVGHYFNVVNDGGKIVFFDSQNGAIGNEVEDYFLNVQPSKTRLWRVDDKKMTDFIRKVVEPNG